MIGRLLAVAAALAASPALAQSGDQAAPPIFRVGPDDGGPYARGSALAEQIKARFPNLESRYDALLAAWLVQAQADAWINRDMRRTRAALPSALREEIDGLADGLLLTTSDRLGDGALSYEEFWLLQASPSFIPMAGGAAFGIEAPLTEAGAALVGRVWSGAAALDFAPMAAVTVLDNGDDSTVLIGPAGLAGVISGFNGQGVFAALFDGSDQREIGGSTLAALDLRQALHGAETLDAVAGRLDGDWRRGRVLLLADQTRVRVLEAPARGRPRLRGPASSYRIETDWDRPGQVAAVGCFALAITPANCHALADLYRWRRLREVSIFSPRGPKARPRDLIAILNDRANGDYALNGPDAAALIAFETKSMALSLSFAAADQRPAPPRRYGGLIAPKAPGLFAGLFEGVWLAIAAVIALAAAALFYARFKRR